MQNRYAGDIGDFGKLGLLRKLSAQLTVGVNWYLVPDEGPNGHGQHINYLTKNAFRECDPPLFDALARVVAPGRRQVAALEASAVLPDDRVTYYSEVLDVSHAAKPEREAIRAVWHQKALDKLRERDLIFADPDNGLIVPSAEGGPKSGKYVLPSELADYYRQGSSVVYYQHRARLPDAFYIQQHRQLMASGAFPGAGGAGLKFVSTSQRFYFFLLQPEHIAPVNDCISRMLAFPWNRCFRLPDGLDRSPTPPETFSRPTIRYARESDVPQILFFIRELAIYENMPDDVVATEDLLREWIFEKKKAEVILAEENGEPVGFALFFHNFSTFLGRAGIYLEDLFVKPEHRGKGIGKALLRRLAQITVERGCGRLEWACLDWNRPSIDFYLSLDAAPMDQWTVYRLTGDTLRRMAEGQGRYAFSPVHT